MSEWISVKDRLPDEDGKYLVTVTYVGTGLDDIVEILYFFKDLTRVKKYGYLSDPGCHRAGWCWYDEECEQFDEEDSVTYWMPLPLPPKT